MGFFIFILKYNELDRVKVNISPDSCVTVVFVLL